MSSRPGPGRPEHLDRALPGWAFDAIRFGLPESEARDGRKVWGMCVRIAMSTYRRGWNEPEYLTEVTDHRSRLWAQLLSREDGRTVSKSTGYKSLYKAWETGVANANSVGMRTLDEIRDDAVELAFQWTDRLTDGVDGLTRAESAVMSYVVAETERRGMLRVTCPGRAVAEFAKVSHRTAARTLASLAKRGLLVKHTCGRRGTDGKGRAAIYGLADPWDRGT